tara:strand:- start:2625 stop:3875 length:1251 start_codon:yes stop_codon:yes gene_type:complete
MSSNLNFKKILSYLLLLAPISFIIGAAIVELIFTFYLIFFYLAYKEKLFFFDFKKISLFFLIFYVYINFNSLFAIEPLIAFKRSFPYFRYFLIVFSFVYFLNLNKDTLLKKKKIFIYIILILLIDSIIQFLTTKNLIGLPIIDEKTYRISSFFGSELILGSYVSKLFPVILSLIFFSKDFKNEKQNFYILLVSISIFFICLLAGERVAILNVFILICYIFFIIESNKLKKYFFSILFVTSLFFLSTDNPVKERLVNSTIESFTVKETNTINSGILYFSEIHHSHILSAYKMFKDKPLIGNGLNSYRYLCNKEKYRINDFSCSTHPHNSYLLFMSDLGILGLIFFLISFFYFLLSFIKFSFKTNHPYVKSLQSITVGILFFYLPIPTGSFFNNFYSYQFFYLVAFYFFYLKLYKKAQ